MFIGINMELNQVTYGNPTQEIKILLDKKGLVDSLFENLKQADMPTNDSELTKEELNEVVEGILLLEDEENKDFLNFEEIENIPAPENASNLFRNLRKSKGTSEMLKILGNGEISPEEIQKIRKIR